MIPVVGATGLLDSEICGQLASRGKASGRWPAPRLTRPRRIVCVRLVQIPCSNRSTDEGEVSQ
jgi:hypothetical protein